MKHSSYHDEFITTRVHFVKACQDFRCDRWARDAGSFGNIFRPRILILYYSNTDRLWTALTLHEHSIKLTLANQRAALSRANHQPTGAFESRLLLPSVSRLLPTSQASQTYMDVVIRIGGGLHGRTLQGDAIVNSLSQATVLLYIRTTTPSSCARLPP